MASFRLTYMVPADCKIHGLFAGRCCSPVPRQWLSGPVWEVSLCTHKYYCFLYYTCCMTGVCRHVAGFKTLHCNSACYHPASSSTCGLLWWQSLSRKHVTAWFMTPSVCCFALLGHGGIRGLIALI